MICFGVDPHKRSCMVAAVDELGRLVGELQVPRSEKGQARLLAWSKELAPGDRQWGVEGAGSYGWPLAQALLAAGESVFEVPPAAVSRERRAAIGTARQKTDATDALAAARVTAREGDRLPAVRGAGLNQQRATLFFQLVNRRYEVASTILTSNKSFEEWGEIFGDEVMATALIDRLLHHCHIVNIRGNSYRMRKHSELWQALHHEPESREAKAKT